MQTTSAPKEKGRHGFRLGFMLALGVAIGAVGLESWLHSVSATSSGTSLATESLAPRAKLQALKELPRAPGPVSSLDRSDRRAARLDIGGRESFVLPNARGEFHRVLVPASALITASVPFPGATPNDAIRVQAEDGGILVAASADGFVTIDGDHRANIAFQVAAGDGLYRVTLRRGGESRVLEFWVGPESPVLVRK